MSDERRQVLLRIVRESVTPVTGADLATTLGVSRQVIVQDVAILRAAGSEIIATPRGYVLPGASVSGQPRTVVAVQHGRDQIEIELVTLVDLGIRIVDVVIEHPVYGELRGLLMVESRFDVRAFMTRLEGSEPLLALTRGVHLHTLEASRPDVLERGRQALRDLGILLER